MRFQSIKDSIAVSLFSYCQFYSVNGFPVSHSDIKSVNLQCGFPVHTSDLIFGMYMPVPVAHAEPGMLQKFLQIAQSSGMNFRGSSI